MSSITSDFKEFEFKMYGLRSLRYALCLLICGLCSISILSSILVAQKVSRIAEKELSILKIEFEEVKVGQFPYMEHFVSITDTRGRITAELEKKNFKVYENKIPVRKFEMTMDKTPLSIVLLLDRSGSMGAALMHMKMAARKFISLLEPEDKVMLIDFSDEPNILCHFTSDKIKLNGCLATLKAFGPTALYDSLYRAVLELADFKKGRPAIVALTDGTDQNKERTAHLSRHTLKEVGKRALAEGIPINTVGLGKFVSKRELRFLAKETNGSFYYAPTSYQLEDLYTIVGRNLKNRIRILYKSPVPQWDGAWRKVELKCNIADAPAGEALVQYRAPGKYVLEMKGQGWSRFKEDELARQQPEFKVRDLYLKTMIEGKPEKMNEWMSTYFVRP